MDLVYINAYTQFYQKSSIGSEDIEENAFFTSAKCISSVVYKRI